MDIHFYTVHYNAVVPKFTCGILYIVVQDVTSKIVSLKDYSFKCKLTSTNFKDSSRLVIILQFTH